MSISKNKFLVILLLIVGQSGLIAQQTQLNTQYLFNKLLYNPAYAGAKGYLDIVGVYRNQWANIDGQPISYFFSISSPLGNSNSNLGLNVNSDKLGPIQNYNIYANYAYRVQFNKTQSLNIGGRGGIDIGSVNNSLLAGYYNGDPTFSQSLENYLKPVFGAGLYFQSQKLAASLSSPNLIVSNFAVSNNDKVFKNVFNLFGGLEYAFSLGETWTFKPATYVRYNAHSPILLDANAYMIYKHILWLGAGYRTSETIMGNVVLAFNNEWIKGMKNEFRIGYSYDYSNSAYRAITGGAHEITISFGLTSLKKSMFNVQSVNPRYF